MVLDSFLMVIHGVETAFAFALDFELDLQSGLNPRSSDPPTRQCLLDSRCYFKFRTVSRRATYFLVVIFYHQPHMLNRRFGEVL